MVKLLSLVCAICMSVEINVANVIMHGPYSGHWFMKDEVGGSSTRDFTVKPKEKYNRNLHTSINLMPATFERMLHHMEQI